MPNWKQPKQIRIRSPSERPKLRADQEWVGNLRPGAGAEMDTIGSQRIWTFTPAGEPDSITCGAIRKAPAHRVRNYMELATKVAELQFRNRDFVLMFRGQAGDYKNRSGYTSLKPSLLRAAASTNVPTAATLNRRFNMLIAAEKALIREYTSRKLLGRQRLARQRVLRWSILQHYEICKTPLLDVTQSLRIAASFASLDNTGEAFLFVLGIPNISGAITASAEAGLQTVRLASVCPPSAVRPHIQEGYLLGEYPECANAEQKMLYSHAEMDFGRRLIAKFRFDPERFWDKSEAFPRVSRSALYPTAHHDQMCDLAAAVATAIGG